MTPVRAAHSSTFCNSQKVLPEPRTLGIKMKKGMIMKLMTNIKMMAMIMAIKIMLMMERVMKKKKKMMI